MLFNCLQLMIVITPHWDAVSGSLYRWERIAMNAPWEQVGDPISISVGKKGMAWGLGLHEDILEPLRKKEGDGRAPAGVFSLGSAFGDEAHLYHALNMPFMLIEEDLEGIDDPASRYYNQVVKRSSISDPDWESSEKMKEVGFLYSLGLVVEHNANPPVSAQGSCIFMHIEREPKEGTAGCTAMKEEDLIEVIAWLDHKKFPRLVQLPHEEYFAKKEIWQLP